ncbi:MAG: hypothetical protein EOM67_05500 [Spirochaetia bacterium]|nr:hypothetical protein [Spirochaetia bacterium]
MSINITHKQFILGDYRTAVMKLGATVSLLLANTILGKKMISAGTVAPDGAGTSSANTGTGTLVLNATTPLLVGAKAGTYTAKCTTAATSTPTDAIFTVYDPSGVSIGTTDAGVSGNTFAKQIKFVVTDKATAGDEVAFVVGDGFAIPVVSLGADGELAVWNPDAIDGSQIPYAILAEDAPINVATQNISVFIEGTFNADEAVVSDGVAVKQAFDSLREKGIFLIHQADNGRYAAYEA